MGRETDVALMARVALRRHPLLAVLIGCVVPVGGLALVPAPAVADPPPLPAGIVHHPPASHVADPGRWIIPGREIVIYRPGVPTAAIASAASASGGSVITAIPALHAVVLRTGHRRGRAMATVASLRGVLTVEPDVRLIPDDADCTLATNCVVPNDPGFVDQWYLENDRATVEPPGGGTLGDDIDAPLGWALEKGSSSVRIAIVDTGIDLTQPDLKGRVAASSTISANGSDVSDRIGHGTAVAGVAGAIPDNGIAIAGVGYNSSLLNIKVYSDASTSDTASCSAVANGIVAAVRAGARVINVSSGGPEPCSLLAQAASLAWSRGDIVVASAGNSGTTQPVYPAAYDDVLSVGATDAFDRPASFSSHGASWVDMAAPGANILTLAPTYANRLGPTDLGVDSGTSVSAPMVSGAAALLFARGLSNRQVAARLFAYSRTVSQTGHDWRYGILDVCNALAAGAPLCSLQPNSPVGTPSPTVGPAPAAGTYRGQTAQDLPVSLTVGAGNVISSLALELTLPCGGGKLTFAPTLVGPTSPVALTPGASFSFVHTFSVSPGLTYAFTASFGAAGSVSGTVTAVDTASGPPACTSGPISWSAQS